MSRDPEALKKERETRLEETQKRLSYAMPMIETMLKYALKQTDQKMKVTPVQPNSKAIFIKAEFSGWERRNYVVQPS